VNYALKSVGEVQVRMVVRRPGAVTKGVSALEVQLLAADGAVAAAGRTEFDGSIFFEKVPPGDYRVGLEPEQSRRLGLGLVAPVLVHVPKSGGYIGSVEVEITAGR
jgi:hypothetical protein